MSGLRLGPTRRWVRLLGALAVVVVLVGSCESAAVSPSAIVPSGSSAAGSGSLPASPTVSAPPSATPSSGPTHTPAVSPTGTPAAPPTAPLADRWRSAGRLHWARHDPIAVVLGDGRVLVFGDEGGKYEPAPAYSRFAELWDPASNRWTRTDPLPSPRGAAAAVTLHDGRALVIGGLNDRWESYSSTYLFNPRNERWVKSGLLDTARTNPAAAVLADGRVLVAGGTYWSGYRSGQDEVSATLAGYRLVDSGPNADGRALATAELYDPATGTWSRTGSMRYARWSATAAMLGDGRVLVLGGYEPPEMYDPATGRFSVIDTPTFSAASVRALGAPMPVAGTHIDPGIPDQVMALADGSALALYVSSGYSAGEGYVMLRQPFRFGPADERWHPIGPPFAALEEDEGPVAMTWGRDYPVEIAVALRDGRVLVAGGARDQRGGYRLGTREAAILDPDAGTWSALPGMPGARMDAETVALDDGSALVIGGYSDGGDGWPVALAGVFRFVPGR
jgi:hypothetical protein